MAFESSAKSETATEQSGVGCGLWQQCVGIAWNWKQKKIIYFTSFQLRYGAILQFRTIFPIWMLLWFRLDHGNGFKSLPCRRTYANIAAIAERCEAISVTSLFAEWTNICRVYCEMLFDVPRPPVDFLISHQSTAINILKNGSTSVSKASKCFSKSTNIFPLQSASALYEYFASYINNHMANVCYPDFRLSRFHIEICV